MAAKRHERTYARKQTIQALYQAGILDVQPASLLDDEASFIDGAKPAQYTVRLVKGIQENLPAIDHILGEYSENWTVDRMPSVDRAILRLACYEMAFVDEVPVSVAINEAVDLAKEFGGEDESPRFVNGVLGRIADYLEEHGGVLPAAPEPAEAVEAPEPAEAPEPEPAETTEPEGGEGGAA